MQYSTVSPSPPLNYKNRKLDLNEKTRSQKLNYSNIKSNRFFPFTGLAKHIRIRILRRLNRGLKFQNDTFDVKIRYEILCYGLRHLEQIVFIFQHDYAVILNTLPPQIDYKIFAIDNNRCAERFFQKSVPKTVETSNKSSSSIKRILKW